VVLVELLVLTQRQVEILYLDQSHLLVAAKRAVRQQLKMVAQVDLVEVDLLVDLVAQVHQDKVILAHLLEDQAQEAVEEVLVQLVYQVVWLELIQVVWEGQDCLQP
jgi:hypothetical protein